jgi:hypothetical protein
LGFRLLVLIKSVDAMPRIKHYNATTVLVRFPLSGSALAYRPSSEVESVSVKTLYEPVYRVSIVCNDGRAREQA